MKKPSHNTFIKFFLDRAIAKEKEEAKEKEILLYLFNEATGGKDIIIKANNG